MNVKDLISIGLFAVLISLAAMITSFVGLVTGPKHFVKAGTVREF